MAFAIDADQKAVSLKVTVDLSTLPAEYTTTIAGTTRIDPNAIRDALILCRYDAP